MNFPQYLKVAALGRTPMPGNDLLDKDGKKFYVFESKFIQLLAEALGVPFTIIHPKDKEIGRLLPDGNWTGIIGHVHRGDADVGIDLLAVSEERSKAVGFSRPYFIDDITFLANKPEAVSKTFAILHPFSYHLWLILAAFFVVMSTFYYFARGRENYQKAGLGIFGGILGQPLIIKCNSRIRKIVIILWVFGAMLLALSYKATLLSFLTFPSTVGIHNIAELSDAVSKGTHECATIPGVLYADAMLSSDSDDLKVIGNHIKDKKFSFSLIPPDTFFANTKGAFISGRALLSIFEEKYLLSKDSFFQIMFSVLLSPSFCCKESLDKIIQRITEAGIYNKLLHESRVLQWTKYKLDNIEKIEDHQISLEDLKTVFVILVLGLATACLSLLVEILISKRFPEPKSRVRLLLKGKRWHSDGIPLRLNKHGNLRRV